MERPKTIRTFRELVAQVKRKEIKPPEHIKFSQAYYYDCTDAGAPKVCIETLPHQHGYHPIKAEYQAYSTIKISLFITGFVTLITILYLLLAASHDRSPIWTLSWEEIWEWIGIYVVNLLFLVTIPGYFSDRSKVFDIAMKIWFAHRADRESHTSKPNQTLGKQIKAYLKQTLADHRTQTIDGEEFKKAKANVVERLQRTRTILERTKGHLTNAREELRPPLIATQTSLEETIAKLETSQTELGTFEAKCLRFFEEADQFLEGIEGDVAILETLEEAAKEIEASNQTIIDAETAIMNTAHGLETRVENLKSTISTISAKSAALQLSPAPTDNKITDTLADFLTTLEHANVPSFPNIKT